MTSNHPWQDPSGRNPHAHQVPFRAETNPTWMGRVQPQNYRQAPANPAGAVSPVVPPALPAKSRSRASTGVLGLVLGGAAVAFMGLFLVLPFLVGNTGIAGFVIGFVASLIPLAAVLLAVSVIDRWEPEPSGC